jgi:dynactin complex subunit
MKVIQASGVQVFPRESHGISSSLSLLTLAYLTARKDKFVTTIIRSSTFGLLIVLEILMLHRCIVRILTTSKAFSILLVPRKTEWMNDFDRIDSG